MKSVLICHTLREPYVRASGTPKAKLNGALRFPGPVLQFATTTLLLGLLFGVLVKPGQIVYVWPVTGIQLALLLHARPGRRQRLLDITGAASAVFVGMVLSHTPLWISLLIGFVQGLELWLAIELMGGQIEAVDALKQRPKLFRFWAAAILAPVIPALAAPVFFGGHGTALQAVFLVGTADSLGIAILTPTCLLLLCSQFWKKQQRQWTTLGRVGGGSAVLLVFLGAAAGIFSQNTNPFLFMVFPPLILVVFVLGLEGAVLASFGAAMIACAATAHGHGPMWIMQGVTIEHRVLILQVFLWTTVATALPVGSLLDQWRLAQREANTNQTIYTLLLQHAEHMIVLVPLDASSRFVSPAVERVLGWTPAEYAALPFEQRTHPDDLHLATSVLRGLKEGQADHVIRYRAGTKDGSYCWVEAFVHGYRGDENGPITGYVATLHDISALKEAEDCWSAEKHALANENEQLAELAGRDELTGIANRRTFNQVLEIESSRQNRSADSLSLLMIDVDSFKKFNDRFGHPAGDACLQQVAGVLELSAARVGDLAARVGGEEFAVLLPQTGAAGASQVARGILEGVRALGLRHPDSPAGVVTVSIGIATWSPDGMTASAHLVEQADRALYESKRAGRNRLTVRLPAPVG